MASRRPNKFIYILKLNIKAYINKYDISGKYTCKYIRDPLPQLI